MDKNTAKKVSTFHGKFIFSRKYKRSKLNDLLVEASVLRRLINELPILPNLASELETEVIRKSIFGTAAIEGNPLNEEQVEQILSKKEDFKILSKKASQEIKNLEIAYEYIDKVKSYKKPVMLTEEFIKSIHSIVTKNIKHEINLPGGYRNEDVKVGDKEHGGVYTPPKILIEIRQLMKEFILWINSDELTEIHPVIRAGLAHFYLGKIHPFGDGNGRTARIIEAILLSSKSFRYSPKMLSNYYYSNIDDYFIAFSESIRNKDQDLTAFLKFYLKGLVESEEAIKEKITFFIRKFSLREYYRFSKRTKTITQRQYDLLMMLLDVLKPINLIDLFSTPPFNILYKGVGKRTARRDLSKLVEMKLLILEDKNYKLNLMALG